MVKTSANQRKPRTSTKKKNPVVSPSRFSLSRLRHRARTSFSEYRSRRPHRSFQLTRRRDYVRSLELPGYWAFTTFVWKTLMSHRRLFLGLIVLYALLEAVFVGLASQDLYSQLSALLDNTNNGTFSRTSRTAASFWYVGRFNSRAYGGAADLFGHHISFDVANYRVVAPGTS